MAQRANSADLAGLFPWLSNVRLVRSLLVTLFLLAAATAAHAGGPRWISGYPYFTTIRVTISWYTNQPRYFTDPGDLSSSVNHAAADALVANAAAVWNIPTASLVLARGGSLDEHVSGTTVYAGANGPVFPADLLITNYASKQIAIVYDSDGSITDMLLGSGASDPTGCLQSGVTESVDSISRDGRIQHAILVLNGRCTGPEPEKQLQLQYQLVRAFGRILGLSWSQTNDNVFTGTPTPTHLQALNWPIMHPIDIVCGLYTYQCLPQPFTLRPDDISALEQLYFIWPGQAAPGKQESWSNAGGGWGWLYFPNGQGMEGVNVVVRRRPPFSDTVEDFEIASAVSGSIFRQQAATSINPQSASQAASMGNADLDREGYWRIQSIPVPPSDPFVDLIFTTEAINPLYTGPYAIGMQGGNTISPSGSPSTFVSQYLAPGRDELWINTTPDAVATCSNQADGQEDAPAPVPQTGWWSSTFCGYQHQAWSSLPVKANRTFAVEVTAHDERGFISTTKAMPTIGIWNAADRTGTTPTVASAAQAFNSLSVGMTSLGAQSSAATSFRIGLADQRGAGRPDFAYQARVLYADSVAPSTVGANGGTVTITGMGFRQGNTVLVNGTAATVTSWSPTAIIATVPPLHTLGYSRATLTSLTVMDVSTGGSSMMSDALTYAAPVEALQLVSAPTGTVTAGSAAPTAFAVKAIAPDGFTSIVGEAVSFSATGAGAVLSPCNASTCTVLTNAIGGASVTVTPVAQGTVTLAASGRSGAAGASFTATASTDVLHLVSAPAGVLTTGVASTTSIRVQLLAWDGVSPRAYAPITLTLRSGQARLGACATLPCVLQTDSLGFVTTTVVPTSPGTIAVQISSISSSVTASFSAAAEAMQLKSAPSGMQTVGVTAFSVFAVRLLAGDGVTPIAGEAVVFTAAGAPVRFAACGGAVCSLTTDAQGVAQSAVTATVSGSVTLSAVGNAGVVTAAFSAVAPPDLLHPVSAPTGIIYVDGSPLTPFAVRITAADGITPVAGRPVTFSATSGAVTFLACNGPVCIVPTDATGLAMTGVLVTAAGQAGLQATTEAGTATANFTAAVRLRAITAARPVQYIAENAVLPWSPQVTLADNSASTAGVPVSWNAAIPTGVPGLTFLQSTSVSNANGSALGSTISGPLPAGVRAEGSACAWGNVCSPIAAQGVAASEWRVSVVSGAGQSVAIGTALAPVTFRVVNATGDPVAGVPVQFEQTVSEWEAACAGAGRCPVAEILTSGQTSSVSDMDGLVRIFPAQAGGVPSITQIAVVAGSQGFVTLTLETQP